MTLSNPYVEVLMVWKGGCRRGLGLYEVMRMGPFSVPLVALEKEESQLWRSTPVAPALTQEAEVGG